MTPAEKIRATLLDEIAHGVYAVSGKLPSEAALGARFGVARGTIRTATDVLCRQGLLERRMGSGCYLTARGLRKTGLIGLIIPDYASAEFFAALHGEIEHLARRLHFEVRLATAESGDPAKAEAELRRKARELAVARAEGIIFRPFVSPRHERSNREIARIFQRTETALVLLDADVATPPDRSDCDLVAVNNIEAGRRIATHLLARGYRRIGFLMDEATFGPNANWNNRLFGLAGELALAGTKHAVRTYRFAPDNLRELRRILRPADAPDALVCGNDETAIRLIESLHRLNRRVPDDLAVIGFDDLAGAADARVPLTTIRQPTKLIAQTAFKTLLARIRYPNGDPRETFLSAPLIVRRST